MNQLDYEANKTQNEEIFEDLKTQLEKLLMKQYLRGLSEGGKTFVASIYQTITTEESKKEKTAEEILKEVKKLCIRYFNTNEDYLNEENKQTIEEVVEKMNLEG